MKDIAASIAHVQNAGKTPVNTPANPVPHNPALPHVVLPTGHVVQAVPGTKDAVAFTDMKNTANNDPRRYPFVSGNPEEQYDIIVTRNSANLNGALPWVIGLGDEFSDNFAEFTEQIPNTILGAPTSAAYTAGNLVLTYTNGQTDTVTVSCAQMPYSVLQERLKLKEYYVTTTRVALSDNSQLSMFSTPIRRGKRFEDGGTSTRPLSYRANYSGYQYTPIVDVGRNVYLSRMKGLLGSIIADAGFSVTYSIFVKEVGIIGKENEEA